MAEAAAGERGWPGRVRAKLGALLDFYAMNADLAAFTLIAPPAAGAEPAERYRAFLGDLLAALTEGRPKSARVPSEAAELGLMGGLVALIVERVDAGSRLVQDAGSTMNDIVASVKRVCDTISEITAAVTEQSAGIGEVNGTVTQLDQMTQQNAALVEQSAAAADSLKEQANKLATAVSSFRIH